MNNLQTLCKDSPSSLEILNGKRSIYEIAKEHFLPLAKEKSVQVTIVDDKVIYSPAPSIPGDEILTFYDTLPAKLKERGQGDWEVCILRTFYVVFLDDDHLSSGTEALTYVLQNLRNIKQLLYTDVELTK
jgi:hypothetical protein